MGNASDSLNSRFFEYLVAANQPSMAGLQKWIFPPGMLFKASEQWWGDHRQRAAPHEGLDLCYFEDAAGRLNRVDATTKIPATFAGQIIRLAPDFLGKSIYLSHDIFAASGRQLYTIYGHTSPLPAIKVGRRVAAGEIIGTVSGFPGKSTDMVPHLHITLAFLPVPVPMDRLNWQDLGRDPAITLIDPLTVLSPAT